jgi:hypothetical protein
MCGSIGAIVGGLASVRLAPRHPLSAAFMICTLIAFPVAALANRSRSPRSRWRGRSA